MILLGAETLTWRKHPDITVGLFVYLLAALSKHVQNMYVQLDIRHVTQMNCYNHMVLCNCNVYLLITLMIQ